MCPQTHYTINVNFIVETLRHAQVDKLVPVSPAHKPDFTGAISCHRPDDVTLAQTRVDKAVIKASFVTPAFFPPRNTL